jgi:hypothetical protein
LTNSVWVPAANATRLVPQHLRIDVHPPADQAAERRQGAELVVGEVPPQLLLGGQAAMAVAQRLAGMTTSASPDPGAKRQCLEHSV